MKTGKYGIAAVLLGIAVIGLTGCETTVENPPAVNTHTTTVEPTKETHTNTVIPVPGPSTNTNTETHTEKTIVTPGASPDSGGSSSSTSSSTTTTKNP